MPGTQRASKRGRTNVGAGEAVDERILEVHPSVDVVGQEVIQPSPSRTLQHEWCVANYHTLVSAGDADYGVVVDQPILWLGGSFVLGGYSSKSEALGERLH